MVGRRLGCCLYIVRVSLEPQASAALLLARNITGRLRELCVHRPWTMLSRSSSRRRVASCSYAAFYRENRIIGRNTGRTTGNTRPRFSLPSRTRVIRSRTSTPRAIVDKKRAPHPTRCRVRAPSPRAAPSSPRRSGVSRRAYRSRQAAERRSTPRAGTCERESGESVGVSVDEPYAIARRCTHAHSPSLLAPDRP